MQSATSALSPGGAMGERARGLLVPGLLLVLAVALLLALFERVEVETDGDPTGAAAWNPWYGAERMLTGLGAPTTSRVGLGEAPPTDHAVIVWLSSDAQQEVVTARLEGWIDGGGHLLIVPAIGANDPFDGAADTGAPDVAPADAPADGGADAWPNDAWTDDAPAAPNGDAPAASTDADSAPPPVASGAGLITRLPSGWFARNEQLDAPGHGAALWAALQRDGAPPAGVIMVVRGEAPSLSRLILETAWRLLIDLALTFAAWVAAQRRFGPPIPPPAPSRRRLMEHVEASGRFLWRRGEVEALLAPARRAALARWPDADPDAVAASSGLSADAVREALAPTHRDRRVFTRVARTLQNLRSRDGSD